GPSAAEQALDRASLELLVRDLRELGDRQRGALVMRELSGLSHEEIALALGLSAGAAKQAIFEARQALLELAEGRAMSCEQMRRMISEGDRRMLRGRRVRGHLRDCSTCAAFAAAIPARRADLQAIAPPLAPLALAGVLGHVLGAGSGHAGAGTSAGLAAAGATGKSAGAVLAAKTAAGVVIVATATVGATDVLRHANHPRPHAPITTTTGGSAKHSGAASGRSRVGHGFAAPLGGGPRANP